MSKDGRRDVHDEEQNCRPSVMSDIFVQNVGKNYCKIALHSFRTCMLISTQRTILYELIASFNARRIPKTLTGDEKMQRMVSAYVDVFSAIPERRLLSF
jgi:hypothetical protein